MVILKRSRLLSSDIAQRYVVHACAGDTLATGGVVTLLSREAFPLGSTFSSTTLVTGRALLSVVTYGEDEIAFLNIHNFDFSSDDMLAIETGIAPYLDASLAYPERRLLVLGGDLNMLSPGDAPYFASHGAHAHHAGGAAAFRGSLAADFGSLRGVLRWRRHALQQDERHDLQD